MPNSIRRREVSYRSVAGGPGPVSPLDRLRFGTSMPLEPGARVSHRSGTRVGKWLLLQFSGRRTDLVSLRFPVGF